jgi:hypothetical protein
MLYESSKRAQAIDGFTQLLNEKGTEKDSLVERRAALAALLDQAMVDENRLALEALLSRKGDFTQGASKDAEAVKLLEQAALQREILVLKKPANESEKIAIIDRLSQRIEAHESLPEAVVTTVATERASRLLKEGGPEVLGRMGELLSHLKGQSETRNLIAVATHHALDCSTASTLCEQWQRAHSAGTSSVSKSEADRLLKLLLKSGVASWERALIGVRVMASFDTLGGKIGFKDRELALRAVARGWKDLHPLVQWKLLPQWLAHSSSTLASLPAGLATASPLSLPSQASEGHLVHRMDLIRSFDNLAKDLSSMGIFETALATVDAQSQILSRFSADTGALGPAGAQISKGSGAQAQELKKVLETQRQTLAKLTSEATPLIAGALAGLPKGFDPTKIESQVWTILRGSEPDAMSLILWNAGARHAASQMVPRPKTPAQPQAVVATSRGQLNPG